MLEKLTHLLRVMGIALRRCIRNSLLFCLWALILVAGGLVLGIVVMCWLIFDLVGQVVLASVNRVDTVYPGVRRSLTRSSTPMHSD